MKTLRNKHSEPEPPRRRSGLELAAWVFGFPVVGGVALGVVGRNAYQNASSFGAREWFSTAFVMILCLAAVTLPPLIGLRELKRRRLESEADE
jgi:hypothetical protein